MGYKTELILGAITNIVFHGFSDGLEMTVLKHEQADAVSRMERMRSGGEPQNDLLHRVRQATYLRTEQRLRELETK